MSFTDSSSDEFPDQDHLPWSQIEDKFRDLLISRDLSKVEIVDFLESFLKFIRSGPEDSRSFTRSVFKYLLATKNLISNKFVEQSCFVHIKNILVIYCVLELRLTTCLHDESEVASNIFTKIFLLMQGSKSVTIMDVLIDIDENIRSSRSKSVMAIVYRHFLTRAAGPPRVVDDNTFIKHLILYRSWFSAEAMNGKVNVFKSFSSTIKPTKELRANQSYSLLGIDEVVDYKKLLQQQLPRNALIRALRDAETITDDWQNDDTNSLSLDELLALTTDDDTAMKAEVDVTLNLPDETISVDDDDDDDYDDSPTISYLPKLFERWDAIDECEWRVAVLQHPCETAFYDGGDEPIERQEKLHSAVLVTHVYEICDDDWCDDESYTDGMYDDDSSDVSDTDSFSSNITGSHHNLPSVSNKTDNSSYQLISEGNRNKYSAVANIKPAVANRKHRKKKRSHFGKPIARCSIDDWIKRKKLTTGQCVASGNVCVSGEKSKNCRITLKRLPDYGQIYGTASGNTNPPFGKIDFADDVVESEDWSFESSTKSSAHTVSKASKSVIRATGTQRVTLPVKALKNCPELGLKKCTVRLKRLPSSQLHWTSTISKKFRKDSTCFQGAHEETTFFESSCPSDCGADFSPSISPERLISTNSTDEQTPSESNSMESFLDQTERLICSPDTTTLFTSESPPLSAEASLDEDKDADCATNSGRSVTTCLKIEFVECDNDKPSPVYAPRKDKRENDKSSPSPVNLSGIADASTSDYDEISAIANFIGST
ncbi:hypothetical protein HA402_011929 [Bradysia odoriphaga]|nr:hypothetical protein HA402_011929 [Bradysia odoriphaga]